jgi:protein-S-isoprenylcysteine O-methyltransferase Ste14
LDKSANDDFPDQSAVLEEAWRRRKIFPTHILLIAVRLMPARHSLWPGRSIIPFPWIPAGALSAAGGIIRTLAADGALQRASTTVQPDEESSELVTGGDCRVSRNPMHLGFVSILAGVGVLPGSLTPRIVVPLFAIQADLFRERHKARLPRFRQAMQHLR